MCLSPVFIASYCRILTARSHALLDLCYILQLHSRAGSNVPFLNKLSNHCSWTFQPAQKQGVSLATAQDYMQRAATHEFSKRVEAEVKAMKEGFRSILRSTPCQWEHLQTTLAGDSTISVAAWEQHASLDLDDELEKELRVHPVANTRLREIKVEINKW